jgi:hypothetical protein
MKSRTRTLRAQWFIDVFNGNYAGLTPVRTGRIKRLLALLKELDEIREKLLPHAYDAPEDDDRNVRFFSLKFPSDALNELQTRGEQILDEIDDRLLPRYRWAPMITMESFGFEFGEFPNWPRSIPQAEYEEQFVVWSLLQDLQFRRLQFLKQCSFCALWFNAATRHQRFCTQSCRKKYASRSEEYKAKRRGYMRGYRRSQRLMDESAKSLARKSNRRQVKKSAQGGA